jgi:hypothetical protein
MRNEIFSCKWSLVIMESYPVIGLGFVLVLMPAREVLDLHKILYVFGMTKNLLSVSCLAYLKCRVSLRSGSDH